MGDKRPAPPLPLENKLLKRLSASVAASAGRGGGGGPAPPPRPLENVLLARLSLRPAALTSTTCSLPLTNSVLAKYEAEHRPLPPPLPAGLFGSSAPGQQQHLSLFGGATVASEMMSPMYELCESREVGDEPEYGSSEEDDDMGMGLFSDRVAFSEPQRMEFRALKKSRARPKFAPRMAMGRAFASDGGSWALPEPQYDFRSVCLGEYDDRPTWTSTEQAQTAELDRARAAKLEFLSAVCVSLVSQPDFRQPEDPLRLQLLRQAHQLAPQQPEFILKVALYSRLELTLRSTSNFLLALAAYLEPCRPFLRKYFCAAVRLPTDWVEVAELYQVFDDSKLNFGSLPAALRKVMAEKFGEFDNYQLAKYNRAGGKKRKKRLTRQQRETKRWDRRMAEWRTANNCDDGSDEDDQSGGEDGDGDGDAAVQPAAPMPADPDAETTDQLRRRAFSIKKLVRLLHVRRPVEPVMAIIGKKYPEEPDAFRRSGLPGTFDSSRAGQRMRLPVPETWETQIGQRGNKADVWQELIDHKKLPYMAMLRNLRNLILARIGAAHHDKVISTLTNENAVLNSKQMAFRYLSAYAALDELEQLILESIAEQEAGQAGQDAQQGTDPGKKKPGPERFSKEFWKLRRKRVVAAKKQKSKHDLSVVRRYRQALDRAVTIATIHNVPPIAGHTIIFCDVSDRMNHVCASAKGMGKPKTARTMALLLSLMCQRSSEHCELLLFGQGAPRVLPRQRGVHLLKQAAEEEAAVERRRTGQQESDSNSDSDSDSDSEPGSGDIATDWGTEPSTKAGSPASEQADEPTCAADTPSAEEAPAGGRPGKPKKPHSIWVPGYSQPQLSHGITAIEAVLEDCLHRRQWVDNVVVLGSGAASWALSRTLQLYRETVNANMQFVNVDLIHTKAEDSHLKADPLNVNLFGFSDHILRFVADRGTTGQLVAVEAIDVKYCLRRDIRLPAINLKEAILASEAGLGVTRWRTVRVFISSTFLDFHGERDLLIRHALPELRGRARALRLELQVVDLRWGITAQDSESARQVELCLSEVDRCQLFVGLLGARAGQTADTSRLVDPQFAEFLEQYSEGLPLTALEMLYATRTGRLAEKALFYERDEAFVRRVPGELMEQFCDLAPGRRRVAALRSKLQSRGCLITKYSAQFGPLGRGRHGATDLQAFGVSVLEQLWNTLQTHFALEESSCDLVTEEYTLQHQWAVSTQQVGRKARLTRAIEEVEHGQGRYVLVSGKPGGGKSSFMAGVYCRLLDVCGAASRVLVPAFCAAGRQCATSAGLVAYLRALLARQPLSAAERHRQAAELSELLAMRGRRQHVLLVLDGLDALWAAEGEPAADWLPDRLPKNVTVLVSADEGGPLYRRLNSMAMVTGITLGPLDLSERSSLVREMLQHHSKTLEEKAWNNQLRTLASKRGAGDPLYLRLACEELSTFGVFEQLSSKLSSLGQTVPALIQDVIARLEESFDAAMVKQALCAVTLAPHGLAEDDLFEFLKQTWPELTQFAFTSLVRSAECLLQRFSAPGQPSLLRLAHAEMARGVRTRYLSGPQGPAAVRQLARALAEYFERVGGLLADGFSWQVPPSVLQAVPLFWGLTGDLEQYRRAVCSLRSAAQTHRGMVQYWVSKMESETAQISFVLLTKGAPKGPRTPSRPPPPKPPPLKIRPRAK